MEKTKKGSNDLERAYNKYYPFLAEVRKRLLFIVSLFLIASFVGFIYYEELVRYVLSLLELEGVNIVFTSPFQFFELSISTGLFTGVVMTFPLIVGQLISFLKPALKKDEYRTIKKLIPFSIVFFAVGFGFGFQIMKYVITIFQEKSVELDIGNFLDVSNFLSKIIATSTLMGAAFQYPIILTILGKFKIIKIKNLSKQRPYFYVGSLIFAALLPPTDLFSLFLLTLPLALLFEITLLLGRIVK